MISNQLTSIELCAGAGGQAIGIENAGFSHEAVVEIDSRDGNLFAVAARAVSCGVPPAGGRAVN